MHLEVTTQQGRHKDVSGGVAWAGMELFSAGDDHKVYKWNANTEETDEVASLGNEIYPTKIDFFPGSGSGGTKKSLPEFFALGATDGKFRFVSRTGRVEKTVDAHRGAITSLGWSPDGSAIVTVGDDGIVKIWSRSGMLRSTLAETGIPVYGAAWSPEGDRVMYTSGKQLVVKPLQPSAKTEQWKAHDQVILCVDWNRLNGKIVSGSEDRKYKVWNSYGQLLYSSAAHDHAVMSVQWSPDGQLIAVGSYNTLRLCDQAGWSHSLERTSSGSIYSIGWTADGTKIAAGCGNGDIVLASVLGQSFEWRNYEVSLKTKDSISIRNLHSGTTELLTDFKDRIVKMSMDFNQLVVATTSQCLIYKTTNWHTPVVFDLKEGTLRYIKQARDHVMLVDNSHGMQVYSYEGRLISSPKLNSMNFDLLNEDLVSISGDIVAVRDQRDTKTVHILDITSGAPVGKPVVHSIEVVALYLDQGLSSLKRHLALVDRNRDIFITLLRKARIQLEKLGTMVQSVKWHSESGMLSAISNGRFVVWYYPSVAFTDPDILSRTKSEKDASEYGKAPSIVQFSGNSCTIKRADGAVMPVSVLPHPALLYTYVKEKKWDDAIRLCRFVKNESMWACLAAMSATEKELNAAEISYAALDEADKVQYIQRIKKIPTVERRDAEMALFCHEYEEAEGILIQAGLIFRAIEMNCLMYRWDRALDLALKNKMHIETVLGWRMKSLERLGTEENNKKFIDLNSQYTIDWEHINAKLQQEAENDRSRPGAVPYNG